METSKLWAEGDENHWKQHLERYWTFVQPSHLSVEKQFDSFDPKTLEPLDKHEWFDFLKYKYFYWKYTSPKRYKTTTTHLNKYLGPEDTLENLFLLKNEILNINPNNIHKSLITAQKIRGLGTAGASGLLAVMHPTKFATVDQFVVKALKTVKGLPEASQLNSMKEERLSAKDGVILISIMKSKAQELNSRFSSDFWTPRKVDMVLWVSSR